MEAMIELKNVSKKYKNTTIIKNISLKINRGEFVVFLGASGGGKTTTLKMMNKLISTTSGAIFVGEQDINKIDTTKLRRKMGYVIQNVGLMPHMTIAENITIIQKFEKVSKEQRLETAKKLIETVGLDESFLERYPSELSGGQQQRIGFARALAANPEIILMDEPFSALDPITRSQLQDEILDIQKRFKTTIVFVTHDIDEALKLADRICVFEKGEIAQFAEPKEILNHPANDYVREFIGADMLWQNPKFISVDKVMLFRPIKIRESATLAEAARKMRKNHVDCLVVVDEHNHYLGVLTVEQFLLHTFKKEELVRDHYDKDFEYVLNHAMVDEAISIFIKTNKRILPVISDDRKIIGLITRANLFNQIGVQFLPDQDGNEEEEKMKVGTSA